MRLRCICLLVALSTVPVLFGCGPAQKNDAPGGESSDAKLRVTATTGMIADAAQVVGGEYVEVLGLMGPGVDPHLYKATAGDLDKLKNADLVLFNGLHLEGRMADVFVKFAREVPTVQVTETIPEELLREPPEFQGHFDPHVWFDLSLWEYSVERVRDALIERAPAHEETFRANAAAYLTELDELHAYAKTQIASIPKASRVLITAHDAFGYFGRAYDIEVMGLQGISTASEYGLQDVDRLVEVIVSRKIKAAFVESSISPKSIEALVAGAKARGHEVVIGGSLYSDALGQAGTPEGNFLGVFRHNVDTIAKALK